MDPRDQDKDQWRIQDVLNSMHGSSCILNLDGTLLVANDAPLEAGGVTRDDVIGKKFWDTYWWSHSPDVQEQLKGALARAAKGEQVRYEVPVRLADEVIVPIDVSFSPLRNKQGELSHIIGLAVDVVGKVEAEANAARQEDFAQNVVKTAPAIVLVLDPSGYITYANPYFENLSGYKLDEIAGKEWFSTLLPKRDQARIREFFNQSVFGTPVEGNINPIVTKSGDEIEIEWFATPLFDGEGSKAGLLCTGQDVTDRLQASSALEKSQWLLIEAEQLANLGSWDLDLVTNELTWSDQVFRIFEIDPEQFEASYDAFLNAIHPEDRDLVDKTYQGSVSSRNAYRIEHRLLMQDGRIKYVVETGRSTYAEDGSPLRSIGTVQDISERRLMEIELLNSKEEAEHANRAKSEFLSRMSHELRTPLNAIIGFAQILGLDAPDAKFNEYVGEISQAGGHLLQLINEVLELSRIETGEIDVALEPVKVGEIVERVLALVRPSAQDKRQKIVVEVESVRDTTIFTDRLRLTQVLLNLLSNATKYSNEGGTIMITGRSEGTGHLRLAISDDGPGISPQLQSEVFKPFTRLGQEHTETEGTGIGLTIAKQLTERMGASLDFESTPGTGATFWVDLPCNGREPDPKDDPSTDEIGEMGSLAGKRVLYIEDNVANARLMAAIFKDFDDIELVTAATGELGLDLAWKQAPDMILLDITLPGIGGLEVFRRLRENPLTENVPVIAISANAMPHDIEAAEEAGIREYVTKPIMVPKLLEAMRRLIDWPNVA